MTRLTLLLAGLGIVGGAGAQMPNLIPREAELPSRERIEEYCNAVLGSPQHCKFLQRIRFVRTGEGAESWYPDGPRIFSPVVAEGQYSCMSFHFAPPILPKTIISFEWFVIQSDPNAETNKGQFWLDPGPMHVPEFDENGNSLEAVAQRTERFTTQSEVAELKWCLFGANPSPQVIDVLSLSALNLSIEKVEIEDRDEINDYCFALDMPVSPCERLSSIVFTAPGGKPLANLIWDTTNTVAPGGGDSAVIARFPHTTDAHCMSLHFDPPWPDDTGFEFWWSSYRSENALSTGGLQVWLNPGPSHNPKSIDPDDPHARVHDSLGSAGWEKYRWRDFGKPIDEVKWCYFFGGELSFTGDHGSIDRLAFGADSGEETVSDTAVLGEYCEALNISEPICARLSDIVFSRTGIGEFRWDENHQSVPVGGGNRSVLSPVIDAGDYSCMSLNFSPPLPADLNISFHWSPGRGGSSGSSRLQLFVAPSPDQVPMATTDTANFVQRSADGFSAWTRRLVPRVNAPVPELKWCYFGANPNPVDEDRGRLDLLRLNALSSVTERPEIEQYCTALSTPEDQCAGISRIGFAGPFRLDDLTWDHTHTGSPLAGGGVSVASPPVGSEYSCMSVYFAEPLPVGSEISFEWALNRQSNAGQNAFLRFYLYGPDEGGDEQPPIDNDGFQSSTVFRDLRFVTGDGDFARWSVVRRTLSEAAGELRWCYFGSRSIAEERDLARIDRLVFGPAGSDIEGRISDSALLADYCAALSMSARLCERVSGIVFSGTGPSSLPWDPNHAVAPSGGGDRSVISQAVDENNYSCMSLRFDPPIPMNSDVSFDWSVGRDGVAAGDTRVSRLQLFVAPPADHDPALATTDSTTDFIERLEDGFSAWTGHLLPRVSAPVSELKWCYFGADTTESAGDRGRIDRLRLNALSSVTERPEIEQYCTALSTPEDQCSGISRIGFASPFRLEDLTWNHTHTGSPPAGGGVSVASPMISGSEYSCLSVYFDEPLPMGSEISFEWALNRQNNTGQNAFLRFYLYGPDEGGDEQAPIDNDGFQSNTAFRDLRFVSGDGGFAQWSVVRRTLSEAAGELRWCYFGSGSIAGERDLGRIDRLVFGPAGSGVEGRISESAVLADYCAALNMSARLCGRVSGIVFSGAGGSRLPWDENHAVAPSGGGDRSVISQAVDESNYSCMSLRFDPPLPVYSDVSFDWAVGRDGGTTGVGRLQLFVAPPDDHDPLMAITDGTTDFIERVEDGFSAWTAHLLPRVGVPVPELKWCYFGADSSMGADDRGRIDRLRLNALSSVTERPEIEQYCTALSTPEDQCSGISRIGFASPFRLDDLTWDHTHIGSPPIGGGISVASPMVSGSEYSCMSVYFAEPLPAGSEISFEWALNRQSNTGRNAFLRFYLYGPDEGGDEQPPIDNDGFQSSTAFRNLPFILGDGGFARWIVVRRTLSEAAGELRWCYFGSGPVAGERDLARIDRLVFGPAGSDVEGRISDSSLLADYCAALSMSARLCEQLSGIVFSGTGPSRLAWDPNHAEVPSGGGDRSVISQAVDENNYSCMSLRFDPPIPMNTDVSFDWSVGRAGVAEGDTRVSRLQLFVAPPADHDPALATTDGTSDFIERLEDGFSAWAVHLLPRVSVPVSELKWCYFGADTTEAAGDRGRIDRLRLNALSSVTERPEIEQYCTALNTPEDRCSGISRIGFASPFRLDDLTWDHTHIGSPLAGGGVSAASPMVSGSEYSCLSVYFDEPLPVGSEISFEWAPNRQSNTGRNAVLRFYLYGPDEGGDEQAPIDNDGFQSSTNFRDLRFVPGDGGFARWTVVRRTLSEAAGELRWCYFGSGSSAGERDLGRIDRLVFGPAGSDVEGRISDSAVLADYCAALSMSARLCERVSGIVFSGTGPSRLPWDPNHAEAPSGGGGRSVISQAVDENNYSCMSLRFDPPIPVRSDVSFDWSVGRAGVAAGDTRVSRLQLFVAPPADHEPSLATTDGTADFIERLEDGFSAWTGHLVPRVSVPVPELKWCYFGADTTESVGDRGRIDRLRLNVSSSTEDRTVIARYCTALNVPEDQCIGISRIGFASPFRLEDSAWDPTHVGGAPAGGGVSVASKMVSNGEYSCMSLYFDPPFPPNRELRFEWDLNREDRAGTIFAFLRFYRFRPGDGDDQGPIDSNGRIADSNAFRSLRGGFPNRFDGWEAVRRTPGEATGELRWCYFGANATAGTLDHGRIDRLVLSSTTISNENEESFSDPAVLAEYCAALNMSALLCGRLFGIVFSGTGVGRLPWDDRHADSPFGRGGRSVLSPAVSKGNYSCMSLRFAPPISGDLNVHFDWSVGRDGGTTGVGRLQLFVAPPPGHVPRVTTNGTTDFIERVADGFSAWTAHLLPRGHAPIPELKWCYFGADTSTAAEDRGRIDRLRLNALSSVTERPEIEQYCIALNTPENQCSGISRIGFTGPFRLEDLTWDHTHTGSPPAGGGVSVASPMLSGSEYSCLSVYFDEPLPVGSEISFEWALNRQSNTLQDAVLRFYLYGPDEGGDEQPPIDNDGFQSSTVFRELRFVTGDGDFAQWGVVRRTLSEAAGELRWCYFGSGFIARERDLGRIDRLVFGPAGSGIEGRISDSAALADYCAALSMSARLCGRVSGIVFSGTGVSRLPWDPNHAVAPSGGGDRSVISQAVDENNYSCMSLRFDPPIPMNSDVSFDWSVGRAGVAAGDTRVSRLQLFVAPPADHDPSLVTVTTDTTDFIERLEDGFSAWTTHFLPRVSAPVPELKWCYFGADTTNFLGDRGRIDRLRLNVSSSTEDRTVIARYCTALNVSGEQCSGISRIGFAGPFRLEDLAWDSAHAVGAPAGGGVSVASPMISGSEYSCLSVYFDPPLSVGSEIRFEWDLSSENGNGTIFAFLRFYHFRPGDGSGQGPIDSNGRIADSNAFRLLRGGLASGFDGWEVVRMTPSEATGALRWCYFGANATAGTRAQGRIDRLVLSSTATNNENEESFSEPAVLAEYCTALSMSDRLCEHLSAIVFSGTELERLPWDQNHAVAPSGGGGRSVLSPAVSKGNYSCMSLRFDPSLPMRSDVYFDWSVGRGGGGGTTHLQLFLAPPPDHVPRATTDTADFIQRSEDGFSTWRPHSVRRVSVPVPELKWCYFGAEASALTDNRGRIDRLGFIVSSSTEDRTVIARYCTALNVPGAQCRQISRLAFASPLRKDFAWDSEHAVGAPDSGGVRSVISPMISNREYSCMSLYFEPPVPEGRDIVFDWDISREPGFGSVRLRTWRFAPGGGDQHIPEKGALRIPNNYTIFGGGTLSGFQRWRRLGFNDLDAEVGELKWCYFGANATAGARDQGRIDRLLLRTDRESLSERAMLEAYCAALNMSAPLCDRLTRVDFVKTGIRGHIWDDRHAASSTDGDDRSVASPVVAAGDYSCLSLHFSPTIAAGSDISFAWSLGRSGDSGTARLQLFLAPPPDHNPLTAATDDDAVDFIRQSEDGFGVWMPYSVRNISTSAPELKWCYFGVNAIPNVEDIGRIDRLSVRTDRKILSERAVLEEYCTALNMSASLCDRLSRIAFAKAGPVEFVWDPLHAASSVVGDDRSVASPVVAADNYSCMSLHFSPPIAMGSAISFDWSLGRSAGSGAAQLQLFVAPPLDHDPSLATTDTVDFIRQSTDGLSAWMPHSVPEIGVPVPELKWCYFGMNTIPTVEDIGRIDRLTIRTDSGSLSAPAVLQEYCDALNLPATICARLSRIDFVKTGPGDHIWEHSPAEELSGGERLVVSPVVAAGDYSCMNLRFDPPFPADSAASFSWSLGRGGGSGSARLQLFLNPPVDRVPMATTDSTSIFIQQSENGFGDTEQHGERSEAPITAIQWCYFGVNPAPVADDRGRIDALRIHAWRAIDDRPVIDRYCLALNVPEAQCSGIGRIAFGNLFPSANLAWDSAHAAGAPGGGGVSVASPKVSGSEYSCLSVYFDPPLVQSKQNIVFEWAVGREMGFGQLRLLAWRFAPGAGYQHIPRKEEGGVSSYSIFDGQEPAGFRPWRSQSFRNLPAAIGELKWCYFGTNPTAGELDRGRVDRLAFGPANTSNEERSSDSAVLAQYCAALNMSDALCDRLSGIVFSGTEVGRLAWDDRHGDVPAGGGDYSVVSPAVSAGNYSCMSLRFSPPIAMGSDISFDWSLGRSGGSGTARLQLFVAPPLDHDPSLATTDDTADFIGQSEDGFSAWTPHSVPRVSAPVAELKWCYFGAGSSKGTDDRGRIDRLRLDVESSAEGRQLIAGYCNALSLPEAHCQRIDRIVFFDPVGVEGLAWDVSPEVGAPGSRDVSLVARRSSCMSLVFDPPWPPFADVSFWWDVGSSAGTEPAGLRLELNLDNENFFALEAPGDPVGGDHTRVYAGEGFAGWLRYRRNDFPEPLEQLRWCYRSGRTTPQPQDRARFALLQLQEDKRLSLVGRAEISPYCEALNMPDWNCERIRYISFDSSDQPRQQWDGAHPMGSPNGGGDISVASPLVAQGGYSCLSLHFDPPLAADSRLRFAWSAGRSGSAESTQMRLWLNPGYGHSPLAPARGPVLDYDSGGAWQSSATADIDVAVREAKWCVLGANQNPSPNDIGRLDVVRFGPYRELISERDRLDEYCAASGLEGMDCALLSGIAFSGAGPAESVWAIHEPYGLSSPRGSPGEESCMRMEFAAPAAATVGRFVFGWSLTGPADSRLRVYRGGEARPVLEFAPSDAGGPGSFPTATVWVPRSADAPNYLLSWCYYLPEDAGADSVAARATVLGISLQQLRSELTVTAPMGGNRRVELAEYLAHALRVDISLGDVLGMAQPELVPAVVRLNSVADMVYQMSAGTLQPLDWRMSLEFGSHTSTTTLYLPQAVVAREQQFRLFSADGVLLAKTSITVPAVTAEDSSATLAINRLCRGGRLLAAEAAMTNCPLLALPGNGFGDWMTASTTASVTHLAPNSLEVAAVAGPSRCLRMLVGVSASRQESSAVQIRFRWRGPPPGSGVELGFYIGQSDVAVALAPSSGMPVSAALYLAQRPEGQQLGWCLEGSSSLASAMGSDWGWFPTDPDETGPDGFLLRSVGIAPLTANVLLAALPYLQECTEQGRRSLPVCLQMIGDVPESLKQHLGLAGDVVITEEIILLWSTLQWLTERGELDVDRDGDQDEHDLRLWLRYQAGLRGEALSQDPVDEARLVERLGP